MNRLLTLSTFLLLSIMTYASILVDGIYYEFSGTAATVTSGTNKYTGSVTIPTSVTSGGNTYSVTSIKKEAFMYCPGLTSVTIPNSVTSIGERSFYSCSGLTSVTIPNSVTSIGGYAFYDCSSLSSITIPNSVTNIGDAAFQGCSSLTSITIPSSVVNLGNWIITGCSNLTSVKVQEGNQYYDSRDNCNAIIETESNTLIIGCNNTVIPDGVTSIGYTALYKCAKLTSITIPKSVTSIGFYAFDDCSSITSVYSYKKSPWNSSYQLFDSWASKATLYVPYGTREKYLVADRWNVFANITDVVGTVKLNSEGYATFSSAYDVKIPDVEVYTAVLDGNTIKCTQIEDNIIPAYNGTILKGEANAEVNFYLINTQIKELTGNELKATTTADGLAELETALVLSGKKFVNYTGTAFVAGKAYMPYDGNSANAIEIVFDGATSIDGIASEKHLLDGAVIKTIEDGKLVIRTANGKYSSVGAKMK